MRTEKECQKKFNSIIDEKVNLSYSAWEMDILPEIQKLDDRQLLDLEKKTEINYKMLQLEDKGVLPVIMQQFFTTAGILVPFLGGTALTIIGTKLSTYNFDMTREEAINYSQIVEDLFFSFGSAIMDWAFAIVGLYLLFWIIFTILDVRKQEQKAKKQVYYEALLEVIRKEKERREKTKEDEEQKK